jgi:zinc-ribbon domain
MAQCEKCGTANTPGSRFCTQCGNPIRDEGGQEPHPLAASPPQAPGQRPDYPPPVPEVPLQGSPQGEAPRLPPTSQIPQSATPPQGYQQWQQQPPAYPPAQQPPGYQVPPGGPQFGYRTQALQAKKRSKGPLFWAGAGLVFVSGVLVLISTWLSWATGPGGFFSLSGWDWYNLGKAGSSFAGPGSVSNAFFMLSSGYPFFTGLCSLILGGAIAFFALLMLALRVKGFTVITIILSLIALGLAITDLTSILRTANIAPGAGATIQTGIGMYIFLIFSALGLGGSIAALVG